MHVKIIEVDDTPRLGLFASKIIEEGNEMTYDYGDRRIDAITNYPWLAK